MQRTGTKLGTALLMIGLPIEVGGGGRAVLHLAFICELHRMQVRREDGTFLHTTFAFRRQSGPANTGGGFMNRFSRHNSGPSLTVTLTKAMSQQLQSDLCDAAATRTASTSSLLPKLDIDGG